MSLKWFIYVKPTFPLLFAGLRTHVYEKPETKKPLKSKIGVWKAVKVGKMGKNIKTIPLRFPDVIENK